MERAGYAKRCHVRRVSGRFIHSALSALALLLGAGLLLTSGAKSTLADPAISTAVTVAVTSTATTTPPPCGLAWRVSPIRTPGPYDNSLHDIAATSDHDVWAAGHYLTGVVGQSMTAVEHWDGTQWSLVPSPNAVTETNGLAGMVAISPDDIWAVGIFMAGSQGGVERTLIEHWNGSEWSIVPSPNQGPHENRLRKMAATSANDVWAVGYYAATVKDVGVARTLTMHWDGTQWSIVPSPNIGIEWNNELWGVTAISANDAWAVGFHYNIYGEAETLTLHWDGTQWDIVPSPNVFGGNNLLLATDANSANDVWAVGRQEANGRLQLIEHWDGTQWSIVPNPNLGSKYNELDAIKAISQDDVWAVGYYLRGSPDNRIYSLAMHWDGSTWSVIPSPSPYLGNYLLGLAVVSSYDLWAAGFYFVPPGIDRMLVEHYSDPCATPSPSPSTSPSPSPPPTWTAVNTSTPTPCTIRFSDVQPADYFYVPVQYLYCHGVISGYADNTFRPYSNTTRAQLCKILALAEGWQIECPEQPHFSDVPPGDPFYCYVETAYSHNVVSGYDDGTFRPQNNVTRAQLCKMIVLAMGWATTCPPTPHFTDVPTGSPFYCFVETAYGHDIITGYADGTFRPGNSATRGQVSKMVFQALQRSSAGE